MGCMAILTGSFYTDFIMEVEARHDDDDASGIIFGMDPSNQDMYYKTMMFNDDWLDNPTDAVNGPFLKINKRNGKPCLAEMTVDTDCFDLLAYNARDDPFDDFDVSTYPNGKLSSSDWIPEQYATYDDFTQHNQFGKTVTFTLVVYQGEARIYYNSRNNFIVGTWAQLPADYAGGMVGLFMSAHQATYTSIKILDLSPGAAQMTNPCKFPGATCDPTVGLCLGGPTPAPTAFPTSAPTNLDICPSPFKHAASDYCPSPVGGKVTQYDTTSLQGWELIDQAPISEPCNWSADAAGLSHNSNAWGTWPTSLSLIGCIALIPDTYTDFIAEYDADHFDNDGWGFIFGYNGIFDHYTAATHNDAWPGLAIDGIPGPLLFFFRNLAPQVLTRRSGRRRGWNVRIPWTPVRPVTKR